ncbi:helix-turn-helix transcriptional regulator [Ferrovibrio sp.]|uniref:helix-turn-helix transcriptional regulator n=1 Tax=Ferrovibrio sp. TaxID=1917215 RepID=UPI0035AE4C16
MNQSTRNRLFGQRLKALRIERGISQSELAEKIGKADDTVSKIETGTTSTRISTAFEIADALGTSFLDLFDWVAPRKLTAEEVRQEELIGRVRKILRGEQVASAEDLAEINAALVKAKPRKGR